MDALLARHAAEAAYTRSKIAQLSKPKLGQKPLTAEQIGAQSAALLAAMDTKHAAELEAANTAAAACVAAESGAGRGEDKQVAALGSKLAELAPVDAVVDRLAQLDADESRRPAAATVESQAVALPLNGSAGAVAAAATTTAAPTAVAATNGGDAGRKKSRKQQREVRAVGNLSHDTGLPGEPWILGAARGCIRDLYYGYLGEAWAVGTLPCKSLVQVGNQLQPSPSFATVVERLH